MGSNLNDTVPGDRTATSNGGAGARVDKEVDFAQYFCTYSFLYHQKEMLSDRVRMDAYYNSIFKNKHHFQGRVGFNISMSLVAFAHAHLFVRFVEYMLLLWLCFGSLRSSLESGDL